MEEEKGTKRKPLVIPKRSDKGAKAVKRGKAKDDPVVIPPDKGKEEAEEVRERAWAAAFANPETKYFWTDDLRSYSLEEFVSFFTNSLASDAGVSKTPTGRERHSLRCPDLPITTESIKTFIRQESETYVYISATKTPLIFVDKTRTFGHTVCRLTQMFYVKPYIFPPTGWTYEAEAIKTVIDVTLGHGLPLRIDHGEAGDAYVMESTPGRMVSFLPHRTLGCPDSLPMDWPMGQTPCIPFNDLVPLKSNDKFVDNFCKAELVHLSGGPEASLDDKRWNMKNAGYTLWLGPNLIVNVIRGLFVSHKADIFRRPTGAPDRTIFQNCLFRCCIIWLPPAPHVELVQCVFEQCTFVVSTESAPSVRTFASCTVKGGSIGKSGPIASNDGAFLRFKTLFRDHRDIRAPMD